MTQITFTIIFHNVHCTYHLHGPLLFVNWQINEHDFILNWLCWQDFLQSFVKLVQSRQLCKNLLRNLSELANGIICDSYYATFVKRFQGRRVYWLSRILHYSVLCMKGMSKFKVWDHKLRHLVKIIGLPQEDPLWCEA